jgi:hypothetical protein
MEFKDDGGSVLDVLADQHVVSFALTDGKMLIEEECDNYFNLLINKEQFGRMIAELQALHDEMEDDA